MNIAREDREGRVALIRVAVGEADYRETVDKTLKGYRRKANIPGFRPGMVPMGIIQRMYGKSALAEETYKLASNAALEYVKNENIEHIGDVMPSDEQREFDFDNGTDFEFVFEIGLAPDVAIELTGKDKVTRYEIEVDDKVYEGYRSTLVRRFGRMEDADAVTCDEALSVTLDNGHMNIEDAYVGLVSMSDKERKPFIGKKTGDTMNVDVNKLYPTPSQRAAILKVREEELPGVEPKFKLTITKIRKFVEPELNDEFFKAAFPDGSVTDAEGLEAHVREQIARDTGRETDAVFAYEVRRMLLGKANLQMPEEFIRRWLFATNEGKFTMEQIESDFPRLLDTMRWNLVQKYYAGKFELRVERDDAAAEARSYAAMQFAQYGMVNVGEEVLSNYADQILRNNDEARNIYDRLFDRKVIDAVVPMLNVTVRKVTADEFGDIAGKLEK